MALRKRIQEEELPGLDDRLAEPETRYEVLDGELVYVPPADTSHGIQHSKISALVEAHAARDFQVASDMLTRTSKTSDVAPDVSVFPRAPDPRTGKRQLEQLAFEVVSKGRLGYTGRKAATLAERGVRRVFAIDVKRGRLLEWSRALEDWSIVPIGTHIADPVLAVPLPVDALIHASKADDAMSLALLRKRNPVLVEARARSRAQGLRVGRTQGQREGRAQGRREGLAQGQRQGRAQGHREGLAQGRRESRAQARRAQAAALAEALLAVLSARGISLTRADRVRITAEADPRRLKRWCARAARCTKVAEMFARR